MEDPPHPATDLRMLKQAVKWLEKTVGKVEQSVAGLDKKVEVVDSNQHNFLITLIGVLGAGVFALLAALFNGRIEVSNTLIAGFLPTSIARCTRVGAYGRTRQLQ